jgi:hypothetical protein
MINYKITKQVKNLPLTYINSARFGRLSTEQGLHRDELDPTTFLYVPTGHS